MSKINKVFYPDKVFYTSDMHFGHKNIIDTCDRPWTDCATMEIALISNWNKVVPEDGVVFNLGDFTWFSNISRIKELVDKLNGTIYHVMGNHCYDQGYYREGVREIFDGRIYDLLEIKVNNVDDFGYTRMFLSHYPHLCWRTGSFHLHGHIHSLKGQKSPLKGNFNNVAMYDVGVDNNDYKPVSHIEIMNILTKQYLYDDR